MSDNGHINQAILNISNRDDITLFPKDLLHLQLPFDKAIFFFFFYCHFINIYYFSLGFMDYVDEARFCEIIDIQNLDFDCSVNFNSENCFQEAILQNSYVYSWVDNYLISTSPYFKQIHDIHPILIYGFDNLNKVYYCSRFSSNKGLEKTTIPINEIHSAIDSAKVYFFCPTEIPFKFLKVRDITKKYGNSVGRFISELKQYLLGKGNRDYSYYINRQPTALDKEFFGIQVTKCFLDGLKTPSLYALFDYRLLHMIVENKAHILDSMIYHNSSGYFCEELYSVIEEYKTLVSEYQKMRLLYIKQSYFESNHVSFYRPPKDAKIVERIIKSFEALIPKEKKVLKEYIQLLVRRIISNRQIVNACPFVETNITKHLYMMPDKQYIEYTFEKPVNVGLLEIYSPNENFEGTLYIDDDPFECHDRNSEYNFLTLDIEKNNVKTIKYYPEQLMISNGEPDCSFLFYNQNLIRTATLEPSSVFSELPDFSFAPENVLTPPNSGTDWTPEQSDKERWLKMTFIKPVSIKMIVICQNENEQRVIDYKVQSTDIYGNQRDVINNPGEIGAEPAIHHVNLSGIISLKLTINKTIMDNNGYDVPRITYIGVY